MLCRILEHLIETTGKTCRILPKTPILMQNLIHISIQKDTASSTESPIHSWEGPAMHFLSTLFFPRHPDGASSTVHIWGSKTPALGFTVTLYIRRTWAHSTITTQPKWVYSASVFLPRNLRVRLETFRFTHRNPGAGGKTTGGQQKGQKLDCCHDSQRFWWENGWSWVSGRRGAYHEMSKSSGIRTAAGSHSLADSKHKDAEVPLCKVTWF